MIGCRACQIGILLNGLPSGSVRGILQLAGTKGVGQIAAAAGEEDGAVDGNAAAEGKTNIVAGFDFFTGNCLRIFLSVMEICQLRTVPERIAETPNGRGDDLGGIHGQLRQGGHMVAHGAKEGHDMLHAHFGIFRVIYVPEAVGLSLLQLGLCLGVVIRDDARIVVHIVGVQGVQQQIRRRGNVIPGVQPVDDLTGDSRIALFSVGLGGIGQKLEHSAHGFDVSACEGIRRQLRFEGVELVF